MLKWDELTEYLGTLSDYKIKCIIDEFHEFVEKRAQSSTYRMNNFEVDLSYSERGELIQLFSASDLHHEDHNFNDEVFEVLSYCVSWILKKVEDGDINLSRKKGIKNGKQLKDNALIYAVATVFNEEGKFNTTWAGRVLGLGDSTNEYGKNRVRKAKKEVEEATRFKSTIHDDGYYSDLVDEVEVVSNSIRHYIEKAKALNVDLQPRAMWLKHNCFSSFESKYGTFLLGNFRDEDAFLDRLKELT